MVINSERQELKASKPQAQAGENVNSTHQLAQAMFMGLEESTDTEGFTKPEFDKEREVVMTRNFRLQRRRTLRLNTSLKHH